MALAAPFAFPPNHVFFAAMKRLLISAAHKSSGKTTISVGLCAALSKKYSVQAFKKGPDYIDPMWLSVATGRPCYNLDFYLQSEQEIAREFANHADPTDIALVEANKGLYDGLALDGSNSNAALAKLLKLPVVLVIDTRGMTRGIAPLLNGYRDFDKEVKIAGVILNQVGGARHESKLRAAVEYYTDIPVLGAVYRDPALVIDERHLGLIPSNEANAASDWVDACANAVLAGTDLDRIQELASPGLDAAGISKPAPGPAHNKLRIGIARDPAFGFYYAGDLEAFARLGAELVPFSTIETPKLPDVDGLFIGGGFPEHHLDELEANQSLRSSIHEAIESGLPAYAECGGLMYLANTIERGTKRGEMVGLIPGNCRMHDRPAGRGYTRLQETAAHPWPGKSPDFVFPAHEFHHSSLELDKNTPTYAYTVLRGTGINGENDGFVYKNLLASYVHQRNVDGNPWVGRFLDFVRSCKKGA